jgi:hypothetical protein
MFHWVVTGYHIISQITYHMPHATCHSSRAQSAERASASVASGKSKAKAKAKAGGPCSMQQPARGRGSGGAWGFGFVVCWRRAAGEGPGDLLPPGPTPHQQRSPTGRCPPPQTAFFCDKSVWLHNLTISRLNGVSAPALNGLMRYKVPALPQAGSARRAAPRRGGKTQRRRAAAGSRPAAPPQRECWFRE